MADTQKPVKYILTRPYQARVYGAVKIDPEACAVGTQIWFDDVKHVLSADRKWMEVFNAK